MDAASQNRSRLAPDEGRVAREQDARGGCLHGRMVHANAWSASGELIAQVVAAVVKTYEKKQRAEEEGSVKRCSGR